ncbi:MAG: HNH endonuclease [Anaerolineaceae bacterium]|nr:HNH endonuclease [Anaerolineaceae bacterium]
MSTYHPELDNPGQQLQELLMELYPMGDIPEKVFISKLDHDLRAEGQLVEVIYKSSINYLVRRLIKTAQYIKKTSGEISDALYFSELRNLLNNELDFPKGQIEKILILLLECVIASEKKPTQKTKDRVVRMARDQGKKCYICGCDMDFTQNNMDQSVEVEHLWPNSLGGQSVDSNLIACCRRCNQAKHDYLDADDFHYEEISFNTEDFPEEHTLRDREQKIALLARSAYKCSYRRCKATPSSSGEFTYFRRNPGDSWHYLNIDTFCSEHSNNG